jgi:D-xylulose reductase
MKAVILYRKNDIKIEEYKEKMFLGPDDVRIEIKAVGICGSDLHYYKHGRIGDFVVENPMVLGHEGVGVVLEKGENVKTLEPGDRVCMEPGIPGSNSRQVMEGHYNLDPDLTFWATPPVDGCLRETVIHPAAYTFKLGDNVGFDEGALIEPLAVGMQAVNKINVQPGDIAVVFGAGTIGIVTALSALAGGCAKVIITDIVEEKLRITRDYENLIPIDISKQDLHQLVMNETDGNGADAVFEATGNEKAVNSIFPILKSSGKVVLIGMPVDKIKFDIVGAQCREAEIYTVFRYANIYPKAVRLLASGKINLKPLITKKFKFKDSVEAFNTAADANAGINKVIIEL